MRLHRFFVDDNLEGKQVAIIADEGLSHQLKRVFRLGTGDQVILLDGSGFEYLSEIISFEKNAASFKINSRAEVSFAPKREVHLFCSLIKKDNFEWILEKGTELGVGHFIPVLSDRSEKKDFNFERGSKILREAAEQSGRGTVPMLHPIVSFAEMLESADVPLIAFDRTGTSIQAANLPQKLGIVIGPEGGWTEKELALLAAKQIPILSLGAQTLRAETGALAAATLALLG